MTGNYRSPAVICSTANDVKIDGSVFQKRHSFKRVGLSFSSKLDWNSYIISDAKTASQKIGAFIRCMKFLSPNVALWLYKFNIVFHGIPLPYLDWCS